MASCSISIGRMATPFTFVERGAYKGAFLPGFRAIHHDPVARPVGFQHVDHMVGNVGWHEMNQWVDFYAKVMGFSLYQHFDDKDISTEYSALMSKVMSNGSGYVEVSINGRAGGGKRRSQIEEYLDFHAGPGVRHIALATGTLCIPSAGCMSRAWSFCRCRMRTMQSCRSVWSKIDEPIEELERLGILIRAGRQGLYVTESLRPVEDRPTLFFEIIQRKR